MNKSVWILVFCALVFGAVAVSAKTPDGKTPSEETICDNEEGAAYGLCVAYCEAMDCTDPNQHASDQGCQSVKTNFEKHTERPLPCLINCPCAATLQLFASIANGTVHVQECIEFPDLLYVRTDAGEANIESGESSNCNVNGQLPLTVQLTPAENLACRISLRRAVEAQGVTCRPPE